MARLFLTPIDLGKNELQNPVAQNLGTAPSSPVKGQFYYDSVANNLVWWDGTSWQAAKGGTVAFGTITQEQTFGAAKTDGVASTAARSDHGHGNPVHDNAAHSAITLNSLAAPTANVAMAGFILTNLGTPSNSTDSATKNYVDNAITGLSWKNPVRAGSTANVNTASPGTTLDGVTLAANDRILLKDQTTTNQNGIYVWTASGSALTRATDADTGAELVGAAVFVTEGTANADKAYTQTVNAPITIGTTGLTWVQFGGGTVYTGGQGMVLNGSAFDVQAADGSLTVNADNLQVNFAGTGTAVTAAHSDHNHDTTYARMAAANCAAATTTTVTHNFNTRDVAVEVYQNSTPWNTVDTDVERTDANNVLVRFATAPAASAYRIVVYARS